MSDEATEQESNAEVAGQNQRLIMCVDSCFDCDKFNLCFMRRGFESQIREGINVLNIDGGVRPGRCSDIYKALGSACTQFNRTDI